MDIYKDLQITIELLRDLCKQGYIKWTSHILARIQERNINPSDVNHCIMTGEIIEVYPNDYPYPSCLLLGLSVGKRKLHVVVGIGSGFLWLITAYYPNENMWNENLKQRKEGK